jgi:exosortase
MVTLSERQTGQWEQVPEQRQASSASPGQSGLRPWLALIGLLVFTGLVFWDAVLVLVQRWSSDPDYHHGFLVPLFAGYLLWRRRGMILGKPIVVSWSAFIAGLGCFLLAAVIRAGSVLYYIRILDPVALIPTFFGVLLVTTGWRGFRWGWPAGVFLVFMLPMPGAVATLLSHPLQRAATIASTFLLQTLGIPCLAEGNVIQLQEGSLEVVQACSGLKMMSLFFAVCVGAAFVMERPLLDRILVAVSAPPIALLANILRITLTGILLALGVSSANLDHELAGWLMMPAAVLILYAGLAIWDRLLVPVEHGPQRVISARKEPV